MVVRPVVILALACAVGLLAACGGGGGSVSAPDGSVAQLAVPEPTVAAQSDSEIVITWSAVSGATHYKLYRSTTSGGSYSQIGGNIAATSYRDSGLSVKTAYYYQLEACNSGGCSGRSPEVSTETNDSLGVARDEEPIAVPTPTVAAQSDSEIVITWSAVSGATHYKLYRSTTSGGSYSQIGGNIAATSYRDSGLSVKTAYYYQLEACNSGGCSGRSPEVSTETNDSLGVARDEEPIAVPTPTVAAQSDSEIVITWSAVSGATHYKLYRSTTSGGSYSQIGGNIAATSYRDSGLSVKTAYYYQLEACNSGGCSGRSPEVSTETNGSLGAARDEIDIGLNEPIALAFSGERVYVADPGLDKIISYPVEADGKLGAARDEIDTGLDDPRAIAMSGERAYVADSGLDKIISYPVEADGNSGAAAASGDATAKTYAVEASGRLGAARDEIDTGLDDPRAIAFFGGRAYVAHAGLAKIISYPVEAGGRLGAGRDEITTGLPFPIAIAFSGGRAYVADLTLHKIISYAVDAEGRLDAGRNEITVRANAIAFSGGRAYVIDFNKIISYAVDAGGVLGAARDEITTGLNEPIALAFSGERAYVADIKIISYPLFFPLVAPVAPIATAQSASEISLSWSAVADATHYKLYRSETGAGVFARIGGEIGATDYVDDDGLEANTSYDYELEACNGNGCSARSAAFSATTALGRPTSGLSATAQSASEISLSWSAVTDATHYKLYRSETGAGVFARISGEIGATDYVDDDGLEANTSYEYELEACNGNGCSVRSAAFSATTALGRPTAGLSATAQSASEISLSWSAVADATHYKLYRSETGGGVFVRISGEIGATDYVDDDGLEANTSYDYELEACNGNGCSVRSDAISATTALGMPTSGLSATTQSASEISLSWSAVADATHYKLYRSETGGGVFVRIGGEIGATDYVDDDGLEANTSYEYELEACNDNGCSGRSAAFSATTALGRPTAGLSATTQSASEISLSWSAVADATHYKLYRSEADAGSFDQIGGDIGATLHVDSGLDANTSYDYELEACNGNGCSARSAAVSATTALGMPTSGLSATAQSASEISISWSAVADATHYKLYRSAGAGSFDQIGGDIGETAYGDSGLAANTSYDYELEACNGNGCSARSAAFSATTALGAPTSGLSATAQSASEISLSWSAVADATHYKLYRSAGAGSFDQIGGDIGATLHVDSGLDANTSYDYELEACNGNGCSARSAAFSATTALGAPTTGLSATAQSASEISISWSAVADATHYKLYRSAAGAGSFDQIGGDIGATLHVDSGLDANTSYDYELEACNGNGCSARSAAFSATTALGRPTSGLSATAQSASEISLSWSAVADATHYKLYRSAGGGSLEQIGGEIGETAYVDSGLDANTSYDYQLEACNGNGCSGRSAAFSATTALGRPTSGLTATAQSASEISLSWSAVADATHYRLYRSAAGVGSFDQIGDDIGATLHVDSGLEANTSYDYGLEACNGNGCSARSAEVSATTALGAPTSGLTAMAQSASEISISWSAVADATHYKLYRSAAGVGSFDQIGGDIGATDYVDDDGLDANTSYDYKLEACNGNGCSARSAEVSATTALGRPTSGLSATAQSASEISISWSAVADATHYKLYRSAAGVGSFDQIGGDIGATDYVDDDGLDANTSYDYKLEACNGNGCSARSAEVSATTALGRPTSGLSATAQSASEISLSWSAVADATHYKLYRSAGGGSFDQIGGEIGETAYVDSGLDANTSYDYGLEACNGNGCSARSAEVSATTALGRPTSGLSATAQSASEISLSWSAVADATHYKLYRSATSEGSFAQIGGDIAATDYVDNSGLAANTSYYYQLAACNGNGCSSRSSAVSATTAPETPETPTATAQSESAISISWSAVAGATHYKLYRSATSGGLFDQIGGDIAATDYVDDNDLAANTSYYYQLAACNGNGCSSRSSVVSATTSPERPSALTVETQSESAISISWSAVAGATHYKLYRSETSEGSFDQIGGDIAATDYVDGNGLVANTSYDYQLEACNDNGCSSRSSAVSATTAPETLETPTTATQSESAISISWSAVAGATHYKLYRSETSEGSFAQIGGEIAGTDYVDDSGLAANTSYYYQLVACNGNGCSSRSSAVSATTAPERPETPTVAAQSEGAVSISWSAVAGATHYKLYRSETSEGSFDQIGGEIAGTDYLDDSGLAANTSYDYQLAACNGNGCSSRSSAVSATTAPERPEAPAVAAQSEGAVSISWSAVAGATYYKLYRSATSGGSFAQIGGDITGTDYVDDSGLAANTSYYYQLESCNGNGCSSRSSAVSATTAPETPETPTVETQSEGAVSISWSAVAGATHYKLYRSATSGGSFAQIGGEIAGTDYVDDSGLAANTSYYYQLVACNGNGCSSRSSAVSATTAPEMPSAPTATAQSEGAVSISWSAVAGATHYKLYRSETSEGSFDQIGGEIAGTDYLDDSGLAANTSYDYQLAACNGNGCSSRSSAVSATTAPERPSAPTTATQSESAVSISWSAVAGATHYKLYRSETSGGSFDQIGGEIAATDYVDNSDLAANTSYYYQLVACNGNGCSSRSSAVSATTAPERPSVPTTETQSEGAVSISWSAVAGATHYKLYRSATSGGSFDQIGGDIAATDYLDDNALAANTSYYYQLESCNGNDCSSRSSAVSATTAPERPSVPTTETQSEGAVSISWSAVAGATHYKLYRSETSGGLFDQIGGDIAATDYVDNSDLAANTSYYYQLVACNGNGCSSRSSAVSATTAPEMPSAPTATAQSDGAVSISWSAVAGATYYKLYRSETSGGQFDLIGDNIAAIVYVDSGLAANTPYYYQLESCNSGGCSGRSPIGSATTAPATPATPRAATQSDSEISIKWSEVAGATHYKLYRSGTSRGLFAQIEGEITATGYLDSNLSESTPYYYQLEACNDNGCSGRSSEVSAATYATGSLGAGRDEITGLPDPRGIAFSGGRAYVADITLGKIISYPVEVNGELGAGRGEITTGLSGPNVLAFSGGRAYVADGSYPGKIISYPVGADGILGAPRDEITTSLEIPQAIAFLGGRAYVADRSLDKIISYPVGAGGELGAGRDEITNDFRSFRAWIIAFSGERAYVVDWSKEAGSLKIISYAVEADGRLSAVRDEIVIDSTSWAALAFSGGRAYVVDGRKIISYPVGADGILGARRDEINSPLRALAFSGGRVYVGDYFFDKIISYPLFSSVAFAVAPDAPRVFAQSESEIEIAWNAVLGATHYKLYRSETSGGLFAQVGSDISITRYLDGNFPANTSYYYQLEACSGDECSGRSPEVSTTTAPPIPSTPTAATQNDATISIRWSAVAGAAHYKLYRSETSDGLFAQIEGEIAATDYVDSGLSANTSYDYQLESCNGGGCSGRSPVGSATTAPATPSELSATAQSGGAVSVVWSEVAGATYYKLYRSDASGGLFARIGGEIAVTSYVDNDIAENTSYYYQLESCNDNGCSGRSPEVSATTAPAIPSAPTAATQSDSAISIKWSAVVGATHYNLYRSETSEGDFDRVGDNIAATDYVDGGLAVNTSYDYQLEACNDNGCSGRSPIGSATTAPAIPSTPMAAAQSDSAISITWSEVAGATHYKLYRATVSGEAYTQIGGDIDALGYLNGDLSETTAYYYQLEACNSGGCSGRSPEVSAATYATGSLGAGRDEITTGLDRPAALAFSGGRAYMVDSELDKIISYAVGAGGSLGEARNEITAGLSHPSALAFSGGRAYVADFSLRKIISYPVEAGGELGAGRDEITTGLSGPLVLAFSGEQAYVADTALDKIISYPVEAGGVLGLGRDEVTTGLSSPRAIVFSGGRAYVANYDFSGDEDKIISYPVETGGELGAARDEITTGLSFPSDLAFSGGRAYVTDAGLDKIISYPVETGGELGAVRDEITTGLSGPSAIAFSGGRAYVAESVFDKIISYPLFSSVPFAVAPDAPRVVAQSEIEIAWNAVLGATHYKLYRSETSGGLFAQVGGDISITRYLDGGFSASIYYYQLEACSGDECSDRSPAVKTAPAAPTAAAQSDSAVSITWSEVAGATHYKLYRSETSGEGFAQIGGEITATGYLDGGLSVKIAYYYQLEACNSGGCSGRSPEISVASGSLGVGRDEITTDLLRPHALAFSGGRAYAVDVDFSGNKNHKIISYPVEADGELGARRDEITTGLSFPFALAFSGGRVYVVDVDFSGDGNKIISYPVEADGELGARRDEITIGLDRPEAIAFSGGRAYVADYVLGKIISYPVGAGGELSAGRDEAAAGLFGARAIAFSGGRAYVADDRTGKIISYPVEADGELGVGRDEITTGLSRPRALAFSGGRAYVADDRLRKIISYPVGLGGILGAGRDEAAAGLNRPEAIAFSGRRAYVGSGNKIISYPLFSSVPFAVAPDAPRVFVQRDNEIEIAWNAVLGATHYKLYRSESSGGLFALVGGDISITRYRDGNLSENTAYYYQLEACNGDECSGSSPEVSAVTRYSLPATPLIPTAAAQSDGAISIAWSAVAGATYYKLYRSETSGGQFDLVGDNIAATDYVDSGLAASAPYYYQLEACNGGGCSGRSPEVSATTVPTTPLIPTATAQSDSAISIKWSAVAGATYYNLYRSETSGGQFDLVGDNIAATDYVDSGLAASAPYYYQLEACNGGGCSGRSPEVSATTVPSTPLIPTATAQSDSAISIKWSAVAGATHYNLYRATASGGTYMQIGGDIDATGYLDSGLSETTPYYYQLEVCNSGGCSGRSPEVSATTYATGSLGAGRDEMAAGLDYPSAIAFSGGRAYVVDSSRIISYAVGMSGNLSGARNEADEAAGLSLPEGIAFSGGRAYVVDSSKITSYPVGVGGVLGRRRFEITAGLCSLQDIAFSGGRAYVVDLCLAKVISYAVGADGKLSAARDEITGGFLRAITFSGGRAYVVDSSKITSYPVGADGILGAERDEITTGLSEAHAIAFSGGRAYVVDTTLDKIISYPVKEDGILGEARAEIGLSSPRGLAFSGGRVYVAANDPSINEYKIISYPRFSSVPFAVAPDAPRVFMQSDSEIEIAWNAILGATHYKLYRSETRGGSYEQVGGDISVTRYQDDTISAGAFYYYQVEACNGNECSGRSPAVKIAPDAPTAAAQSDTEISITWSAVAGATHYNLYRATASGGAYMQIGGDIDATGYLDSGLSETTAYYYQLEVCNSGGCSGRSPEVSATTYATGSLGAGRDEITTGLDSPGAIAFSGGRAYMADFLFDKIISYPVGAGGELGAGRDEITTGLSFPFALAFSGGRAYVADFGLDKIISYPVGADGILGAGRDEITAGLAHPLALAFSGGRAYVADSGLYKIISYPVGAGGELGAGRDEITTGLPQPFALAFSGGRAYVADFGLDKIISYPVGADGILGAGRDEITAGLDDPSAIAFSGGRAYVTDKDGKIISYPVEASGELGAGRDEITTGLPSPRGIAFSGGRAYVVDERFDKIISYPRFSSVAFAVVPDAPRVFAQSDREIEIAWNAVLGATHYKLYRSETSGGMYIQIGGDISVTRYLNEDLSANTSYYYQLEACSGDECSGSSPKVSASTYGSLGAGRDEITIGLDNPSGIAFSWRSGLCGEHRPQ